LSGGRLFGCGRFEVLCSASGIGGGGIYVAVLMVLGTGPQHQQRREAWNGRHERLIEALRC
jgi:hypothetical protein